MTDKTKAGIMYVASAIFGFVVLYVCKAVIPPLLGGGILIDMLAAAIGAIVGCAVYFFSCHFFAKMFKIAGPKV